MHMHATAIIHYFFYIVSDPHQKNISIRKLPAALPTSELKRKARVAQSHQQLNCGIPDVRRHSTCCLFQTESKALISIAIYEVPEKQY
jgi:hypothetical protein